MIRRVGVIYQDVYSRGFLEGLKRRLKCDAELIPPAALAGRSRNMTPKQAKNAWRYLQQKQVDIVVRFTDADAVRWQNIKRDELAAFPAAVQPMMVCGVAVNNTEEWLALDPDFIARQLGLNAAELRMAPDKSSVLKGAINRNRRDGEDACDVVTRLVVEAPPSVFKKWLQNDSFREFYEDCRRIASGHECETPNEL